MMKLRMRTALLASAALLLGLASCKSDRQEAALQNGECDTYVGVSVRFPAPETRALPDDHNKLDGEWQGRDVIKKIKVYVATTSNGATTINSDQFTEANFGGINNGILAPNLAVEAKSGDQVKVYVVINDMAGKVTTILDEKANTPATFDAEFQKAVAMVAAIADVAKYDAEKDIVLMTNETAPVDMTIEPNISKEDAIGGKANRVEVKVSRVASRAIATVDDEVVKTIDIKRTFTDAKGKTSESTTATVTVKDIMYQVTGSALQFNVLEDRKDWKVAAPVYGFAPTSSTWTALATEADGKMLFSDAEGYKAALTATDNTVDNVKKALGEEKFSKFVLPVTHAKGNYKKGNTTMFEIKATFTVDQIDGAPADETVKTVYLGLSDGKFYSTKEKAEAMDAALTGTDYEKKQSAKEYTNGEMYYYIWLNPDVEYSNLDKTISESPTVRNQVYHAHITGFGEMGVADKDEIKPDEPLETKKTHLSVQLQVLPWTIHSYTVNLVNRY
ncbi:Mfa1 family fimbria major subunit [uncultured Porphyromonas sp.]|uniref:Mfa1 family fimbria major subunit n=1 Tax=uncultured Porphyromonas sp. TaxID=159274 RepID=UPI002636AC1D|nr:Mfa1 family fimbria major subunit [uncultured Porphyromonas sp.]